MAAQDGSSGGKFTIDFVVGASSDPFFSTMKRGADDAAKALEANGGSLRWLPIQNYNNFGPDLATLLQTAISQKPAAVAAIDPEPGAEDTLLKQISSSGIPLITVNSGDLAEATKVGAIYYVGSDDVAAGKLAGDYLVQQGLKHALCVNTIPGTPLTEDRCDGIKAALTAAGGASTELPLPASNFGNPTAVAQAIKAALLKDTSIDGVVTLDEGDADSAASALKQANLTDKVKLGSFDLNSNELDRIKAGTQLFVVDQQPYMQGYLAVSLAYQYVKFGLQLPASERALLTGPVLVTKDNVQQAV
ncbi:MAG TPA: sugar ABC transporter substrate-binding protein, partial [Acidothermaceae bacterium]